MAEHPFERFRRLRGLAVPEGPAPPPAVQDAEALPLTPLELFQRLHARGVRLRPFPDGTLQCQAPDGAWTPALRQAFQTHHGALHALVETFEERAAMTEYCGGLTRAAAEQVAWQCVPGESPGQRPQTPAPAHTEGMTMSKREASLSQDNYVTRIHQMWQTGALPPEAGVHLVTIYHDDWCGMYQQTRYNCDPDIRLKVTVPGPSN